MQWPTWCQCALHPHIASFNTTTGWCNGHVDATNATTHTHHHAESHQVGAMAILMPQMQPPTLIIFQYHCLMPWPCNHRCTCPFIPSFSIIGWGNDHIMSQMHSSIHTNLQSLTSSIRFTFKHKPNHIPSMHMPCITQSNNFTWLKPKISHVHSHQNYSFSQDLSKQLSCNNWQKIPHDRWVNLTQASLNHIFP